MQRLAESSEGYEAAIDYSADGATHRGDDSGNSEGSCKDKKQTSGWLNKSVFLASAVLRNDHVAAKKSATQMSNHDVAGPLIKKHMDSQRWY